MTTRPRSSTAQVVAIIRHADAAHGGPDRARPLSPRGLEEAERVAARIAELGLELAEFRHSGRERARHTAAVFAAACGAPVSVAVAGLDPDDDPDEVALELEADRRSLALVAHMPLVGRLASRLLTGDPDRAPVFFPTAGVLVLRRVNGSWERLATLAP